ncbi:MAG: tRNA preQ1(34) S-adenosylmethionine ribosyltransferase-isomerase QueA [Candidatus Acidiferrum sp.]
MRVDEFDYVLPHELIAQRPLTDRERSRMLFLSRRTGEFEDRMFRELPSILRGDELVVLNNARVLPARLFGRRAGVFSEQPSRETQREHLHGQVEVFLTRRIQSDRWEALVRPGRKLPVGERIHFGDNELQAEIVARGELGLRTVQFVSRNKDSVSENIQRLGHVPLPPYIDRPDEGSDRERYQTVFAQKLGAVAAPTAGLHFTTQILEEIRSRGCEICELTLDVGLGTFQPIHCETLEDHKIHTESYEISEDAAVHIHQAKKEGRKILAVGTTVVRALEDSAGLSRERSSESVVLPGRAHAGIFITPGYSFRVVDMLLTNFHLPRSTLLALVSAFAGRENILRAYRHAVSRQYRFFSYGDCMLLR